MRRTARPTGTAIAPVSVVNAADAIPSSAGAPLPPLERAFMEARIGHDFTNVRVHHDADAETRATRIKARAYTIGRDIVFGSNEYAPGTPEGRRLLAHELTHVAQQSGSLRTGRPVGRTQAVSSTGGDGIIQRTPGVDARDSWNAIATVSHDPDTPDRRTAATEAIDRVLRTSSGTELINRLWNILDGGRRRRLSRIAASFVDVLPTTHHDMGAGGYFDPDTPGAPVYDVVVRNSRPAAPSRGVTIGGTTSEGIPFSHTDPESQMAHTLFHELLHVWFVNDQQGAAFPTGHGDVLAGEIEPVFESRLRTFVRQLDALETQIHQEAAAHEEEARRRQAEEPPSVVTAPRPTPERRSERRTESGPAPVGGEVSLGLGFVAGQQFSGPQFASILGADLILNTIGGLRIGARGIYLTPNHLLTGGTLGIRLQQDSDGITTRRGRVENPIFFDLEAGILAELAPNDATRITQSVVGIGSIGIGQEIQTGGPRIFWRLGGFVVISDTPPSATPGPTSPPDVTVGGGATAGGGIMF